MKRTTFRFEIRVAPNDCEATLDGLNTKLNSLQGINSVSDRRISNAIELSLDASFEDAEEAEKLHRKVMTMLTGCESVVISNASTTLTDIY